MKSFEALPPKPSKEESGVRPISKKKQDQKNSATDAYLDQLQDKLEGAHETKEIKLPEAVAAGAEDEDFDVVDDIPGESPAEMWGVKAGEVDEDELPAAEGPKPPRRKVA